MLADVNHESRLKKEGYGQYTASTCWLACYRMLYKWADKDASSIRGKLSAAGLNYNDLYNRGILPSELPSAGSALKMCGWDGTLVRSWNDDLIVHVLYRYGPLFYVWDYGKSGHALLIVGFDATFNKFKVYNPYNQFSPGVVEVEWMTLAQFRNNLLGRRWALQAWY